MPISPDLVDKEKIWKEFSELIRELKSDSEGSKTRSFADFCFRLAQLVPGIQVSSEDYSLKRAGEELSKASEKNQELLKSIKDLEQWSQVRTMKGEEIMTDILKLRKDFAKKVEQDKKSWQKAVELRDKLSRELHGSR